MNSSKTFKIELGENCNQQHLYDYMAKKLFEYKPEDHKPGYIGGDILSITVGEATKETHTAFIYHTKSGMIIGKLWETGKYHQSLDNIN